MVSAMGNNNKRIIMEKYYTPEIEEFHFGFEFEELEYPSDMLSIIQEEGNWLRENRTWKQRVYGDHIWAVQVRLDQEEFRVKYLDRDDIADLGFKHLGSGWFEKDAFRIRKWSGRQIDVYDWDRNPENGTGDIIFRGDIKNRSELKQLLKQLHIK